MNRYSYKTEDRRVGMRWGRVLNGLECAKFAMGQAYGDRSVLPDKQLADDIVDIYERIIALEQRVWREETALGNEESAVRGAGSSGRRRKASTRATRSTGSTRRATKS